MDRRLTRGEDRSCTDGWTGYTWNKDYFPDHVEFICQLHARGLKTALNLHPAQGVRPWEAQYEAMCAALGLDPTMKKPVPFFCLDKDFLKAYFEILHFPYEADGVDFWWMDWQQGTNHKAGAIVPMQKHISGSNVPGGAGEMEIVLAPGGSNAFTLYEDDGSTLDYRQGRYALTPMTLDWHDTAATFTIHPVQGDVSFASPRRYTLRLIDWRAGCAFAANSQSLAARWDASHCTYTISLPEAADAAISVAISNPKGLTHDNSDIRERCTNRLLRAQGLMSVKDHLLKRFDAAIEHTKKPGWCLFLRTSTRRSRDVFASFLDSGKFMICNKPW